MALHSLKEGEGLGPYDFFMLALCIFALVILLADTLLGLSPSTDAILQYADTFVCLVFLGDFTYNVVWKPHRLRYLVTWGWIDLLSSIPTLDTFRLGRAARLVRILKVIRAMKSARAVGHFLMARRSESAVLSVALACILLVVFSSLAILQLESPAGGNIQSAEDAVWWAIATLTPVGNSEKFATTSEGRFIAVLLKAAGMGLFATVSGSLGAWFISPAVAEADSDVNDLKKLVEQLRDEVRRRP